MDSWGPHAFWVLPYYLALYLGACYKRRRSWKLDGPNGINFIFVDLLFFIMTINL